MWELSTHSLILTTQSHLNVSWDHKVTEKPGCSDSSADGPTIPTCLIEASYPFTQPHEVPPKGFPCTCIKATTLLIERKLQAIQVQSYPAMFVFTLQQKAQKTSLKLDVHSSQHKMNDIMNTLERVILIFVLIFFYLLLQSVHTLLGLQI